MSETDTTFRCTGCKFEYKLGPANTTVFYYRDRVYCSYFKSVCPRPQCNHEENTFWYTEKIVACIKAGWPLKVYVKCPQDVLDQWCELNDTKLVEPVGLTQRQEQAVAVLHWELEDVTVQDILDTPIENKLPREWL